MEYQPETLAIAANLPPNTVGTIAHHRGLRNEEPIIVILDALIKYAKAYNLRFSGPLANSSDPYLADTFLDAAIAIRKLLTGIGGVAMLQNCSTDSKDDGACEAMFWKACELAGFSTEYVNDQL